MLSQTDFQRLKNICRQAGFKLTHQRLEIYRELAEAKDHPSAEVIFKRVRDRMPTISLDTVYRTLSAFEQHGFIMRTQVLDDRARFDADLSPHHHLVCARCKSIEDFHWEAFDKTEPPPSIRKWGRIMNKQVALRGICNKCLKAEGGS